MKNNEDIINTLSSKIKDYPKIQMKNPRSDLKGCDFQIFEKRAPGLCIDFRAKDIKVSMYMENGKKYFDLLMDHKDTIDRELGREYVWTPVGQGVDYRIYTIIDKNDCNLDSTEDTVDKILEVLVKMTDVFSKYPPVY